MKPWAATCAVGSELGLLSAFHESWEPVNLAGKALGLTFYCCSDRPALQPSACVQSYRWTLCFSFSDRGGRPYCFTSCFGVPDYVFKCECMCAYECVCTSFHEGRSNDKMSCDQ